MGALVSVSSHRDRTHGDPLLLRRVDAGARVSAVGPGGLPMATDSPWRGAPSWSLRAPDASEPLRLLAESVRHDFIPTLGLHVLDGRGFELIRRRTPGPGPDQPVGCCPALPGRGCRGRNTLPGRRETRSGRFEVVGVVSEFEDQGPPRGSGTRGVHALRRFAAGRRPTRCSSGRVETPPREWSEDLQATPARSTLRT